MAKNYLPKYRKAILNAITEQRIKLNDDNSHVYNYFKDGEEHSTREHWALTYLKYDRADYEEFAKSTIRNNNLKQDSLKPVNPELYLEAVDSLLKSPEPLELAIAIAAVTGRRYSEVMAKGHFSATDYPYQIHFSGQLKKRTPDAGVPCACRGSKKRGSDDNSYTIYTLVPADKILAAIDRFRTHPDITGLENASIEEINQLNTPVNRLIEHYFQNTDLVPVLNEEARVTIQNLRGIYGEIAVHFFCPPDMGVHRFIQQKLGHLINDTDLSQRKNSGSTEHYFHYYLVDGQDKQLAEKGILLERLSSSQETIKDTNYVEDTVSQVEQLERTTQERNSEPTISSETKSKDKSVKEVKTNVLAVKDSSELETALTAENSSEISQPPQNLSPTEEKASSTTRQSSNLDPKEFLTCIQDLLDSDNYQHLLVGLMAVTGLDAASLLKLLVFKEAAAPHLILYCQQLHPTHLPLQQLLTLLDAELILDAIARLSRDRNAIDFAHCLTGAEINDRVARFTPDILESVDLSSELDLAQQYHDFIPLLLKENVGNHSDNLPVSEDTRSYLEQWQQHFNSDLDATLNELMRLASSALSSSALNSQKSEEKASSNSQESSHFSHYASPSPNEPSPWLAISRLAETVARLSERVMEQSDLLLSFQLGINPPSENVSPPQSSVSQPRFNSLPRQDNLSASNSDREAWRWRDRDTSKTTNQKQGVSSVRSGSDVELHDFQKMSSEELKASRARSAPIEKLNRALDAVIHYNQQQSKPEQMWRINTHLLQQLTGCFNSSVKHFVKEHQPVIDDHNHQLGLTSVRHNGVHNNADPNDFISW